MMNINAGNILFQRIKEDDVEAYESLFHAFYEKLCTYAYSILRNKDVSEEIVQDVFIKLWEDRQTITIHLSVNAYLYRIVHNSCQNHITHIKVHQKFVAQTQLEYEHNLLLAPLSQSYPIANLLRQEIEKEINDAVNSLPEQCRQVFMLCRYEDLSYAEVAERLGISVNTVKTQLQRAVSRLRTDLKKYMPIILLFFPYLFD